MDYKSALSKLANRFKEPSSWAGIGALAMVMGIHADPGLIQAISFLGAGVAGLVSIFMPEKTS